MLQTRPRSRLLAMTVTAILTVGCGANDATQGDDGPEDTATAPASATAEPTETVAPSPSGGAPEGWERFEVAERGFAISLPRAWEAVDLTSEDIDRIVEFLQEDPRTAPIADQLPSLVESGVAFFAVSVDAASMEAGFATNLNIIVQPDVGMSLDLYAAANISFIEEQFQVDVAREDVELPAGEAVRVEYETAMAGTSAVHQVQFYLVVNDQALIATFTRAVGDDFAELDAEFTEIIETLEILP